MFAWTNYKIYKNCTKVSFRTRKGKETQEAYLVTTCTEVIMQDLMDHTVKLLLMHVITVQHNINKVKSSTEFGLLRWSGLWCEPTSPEVGGMWASAISAGRCGIEWFLIKIGYMVVTIFFASVAMWNRGPNLLWFYLMNICLSLDQLKIFLFWVILVYCTRSNGKVI